MNFNHSVTLLEKTFFLKKWRVTFEIVVFDLISKRCWTSTVQVHFILHSTIHKLWIPILYVLLFITCRSVSPLYSEHFVMIVHNQICYWDRFFDFLTAGVRTSGEHLSLEKKTTPPRLSHNDSTFAYLSQTTSSKELLASFASAIDSDWF